MNCVKIETYLFTLVTKYNEVLVFLVIAVVIAVCYSSMGKSKARSPDFCYHDQIMNYQGWCEILVMLWLLNAHGQYPRQSDMALHELASLLPPLPWQQGSSIVKSSSLLLFQPADFSSIISSRADTPTLRICAVRPLRCLSSPGNLALHLQSGQYILRLRHDLLGHFILFYFCTNIGKVYTLNSNTVNKGARSHCFFSGCLNENMCFIKSICRCTK